MVRCNLQLSDKFFGESPVGAMSQQPAARRCCLLTDKITTTPTSWKALAKDKFAQMERISFRKGWKKKYLKDAFEF